jgi:hypothetical protein
MEIPWTNSRWSVDELTFQRVEFRIFSDGKVLHGVGQFLALQNPEGQIALEILSDAAGSTPQERLQTRFSVPKAAVDRIEHHPDPSVALFQLYCI